jgi:3-hydroxyacyl-CoA dehydrogenase
MSEKYKIGIIGSGAIGAAYAALFTGHGYQVVQYDISEEFIKNGLAKYEELYDAIVSRGLFSTAQREEARSLLSQTLSLSDLNGSDIIFECIPEDIEMKKALYVQVEEKIEKVLALVSTSSALSPDDLISDMTKFRSLLVVGHPFNPPHLAPFVELVRSKETDDSVVEIVTTFLESNGRQVSVMTKTAPGFIANRLQHALLREAMHLVDEGLVSCPEDVDKALTYSFMPRYTKVGIFEHHDFFGMDNTQKLQNYLYPYLYNGQGAADMVNNLVEKGELGMKTGKGIYEWDEEKIADFKERAAEPYWKFFDWQND